MLKKMFEGILVLFVALFTVTTVNCGNAYAATPSNDTWVMTYGENNYYVKAKTLELIGGYNPDAGVSFRAVVIAVPKNNPNNASYDRYEFLSKGMLSVSINGGSSFLASDNDFYSKLYGAIARKLIY